MCDYIQKVQFVEAVIIVVSVLLKVSTHFAVSHALGCLLDRGCKKRYTYFERVVTAVKWVI